MAIQTRIIGSYTEIYVVGGGKHLDYRELPHQLSYLLHTKGADGG